MTVPSNPHTDTEARRGSPASDRAAMGFLQKALRSVNSAVLSSKQSLGIQLKLQPEQEIFAFRGKESVGGWVSSGDRAIGGLSECKWGFYDPKSDSESSETDAKGIVSTVRVDDGVPSAVFTGRLSLACQPTEVDVVRSGYCGVRASVPSDLMLHGYEGISMRVMTDGREYRMNIQMDSWNPLNLYMGFIRTPPNEWVDIELPFRHFMLTSRGYVKLDDETPLNPAKLRSIGFAIADQKEGDFELRIQWIKAIAQVDKPASKDEKDVDDDSGDDAPFDVSEAKKEARVKKPSNLAV